MAAIGVGDPTLLRTDTGADGAYLVDILLDEEPRSDLRRHLEDPVSVYEFHVPSGRLIVAGEECLCGAQPLSKALGQEVDIPAGTYRLTAYGADDRDATTEQRWKAEASPEQQRSWSLGNSLAALSVGAVLVTVIAAVIVYLATRSLRSAEALYRRIERDMPSVVLTMEKRS